jgi:hypothetical protein
VNCARAESRSCKQYRHPQPRAGASAQGSEAPEDPHRQRDVRQDEGPNAAAEAEEIPLVPVGRVDLVRDQKRGIGEVQTVQKRISGHGCFDSRSLYPCTARPKSRIQVISSSLSGPFSRAARFSRTCATVLGADRTTSTCGLVRQKR